MLQNLVPTLATLVAIFTISACGSSGFAEPAVGGERRAVSLNARVLAAVAEMPSGGGYNTSKATDAVRQSAVRAVDGKLVVEPLKAQPSYCSGATYLVLLKVLRGLQDDGQRISAAALQALAVADAKDGVGVWGRWNANGPGTAKFFHDTGLGLNFTELSRAEPGDFLKIFWTDEVGRRERGHSVVYLGHDTKRIYYWSSNDGVGYGRKSAERSKCRHLLFSRLTSPDRIERVAALPRLDSFLASMLRRDSSRAEMLRVSGVVR